MGTVLFESFLFELPRSKTKRTILNGSVCMNTILEGDTLSLFGEYDGVETY